MTTSLVQRKSPDELILIDRAIALQKFRLGRKKIPSAIQNRFHHAAQAL
jgi:hypothetical protein